MLPEPISARDLNIYGDAELPWSRVVQAIEAGVGLPETPQFLGTVGAGGRPHSAGIGVALYGAHLYFTSGPGTRKSRDLAANPQCTLSFRFPDVDLVLEGEAHRTVDPDELDQVTATYRRLGWPAERAGDAITAPYSAQSAGPAPWHLYRFTPQTAAALALTEPHGATHWRFG
ncbi:MULTISPECIES: pyridoxamine 5'-phosphate oxidase family protein [unclassified Nocardia]|uniref:pyridoxamine 5'-phosphate oxidase family protein n=1 Tax=unclassified Nocardia TaxID=2637762 RepID=UPI00272DCB6E|nr:MULTISPECIES: pyridoxamine 5'-phosphate oxidase family protein [unclassified Nocardia]